MPRVRMSSAARRLILAVLSGLGLVVAIAGEAAAIHENQHAEPFNDTV
jgi:hypothetical protein